VAEEWLSEFGELTHLQKRFLERALSNYQRFAEEDSGDPQILFAKLQAQERVGIIQARLGEYESADATFRALSSEAGKLSERFADRAVFRFMRVSAGVRLAQLYEEAGRAKDAQERLLAATAQANAASEKMLQGMEERRFAAASLAQLCGSLIEVGNQNSAELCIQRSVQIYQSIVQDDPESWGCRLGLASAMLKQGNVVMWWGMKNEEAMRLLRDVDRQLVVLLAERPASRQCQRLHAGTLLQLGVLSSWSQDYIEERKVLDRAAAVILPLVKEFPNDRKMLELYVVLLNNQTANLENLSSAAENAEAVTVRSRKIELLQTMTERFPEVVEYRTQLASAVEESLLVAYSTNPEEAYDLAKRSLPRLLTLRVPTERSALSLNLAAGIGRVCLMTAECHLEHGECVKAMEILRQVPAQLLKPDAQRPSDSVHPDATQQELQVLTFHESVFMWFLQLNVLYRECARQIEADMQLDDGERGERLRAALVQADEYGRASAQALANWSNRLASYPELVNGSQVLFWCDKWLQATESEGSNAELPPIERRLRREAALLLCREAIRVVKRRMNDERNIHFLVGHLTAGPEELRDSGLAVEIAQAAVSLMPNDEFARQNLGWALFRSGKWADSLEMFVDNEDESCTYAVTAMDLWHLGRKEEALRCMSDKREAWLSAHAAKSRRLKSEDATLYPTPEMLYRLDVEASDLLGVEPAKRFDNSQDVPGGEITARQEQVGEPESQAATANSEGSKD
jgi:tetratricopeptide (TPR) repeat protein